MDKFVRRTIPGTDYPMPEWLALKYDELERKKNLFAHYSDFAEILILEHDCAANARRLIEEGRFAKGAT